MLAAALAIIIFVVTLFFIITEKIERHWVSLASGALMLIIVFGFCMRDFYGIWNVIALNDLARPEFWFKGMEAGIGINWATIIFLAGMMLMVEGMNRSGFFRWLCLLIAKVVHYRAIPILVSFMIISFVLSMFIDSITVVLFLAGVTVELSRLLKFEPVPVIIAEIFCSNLGGSATMCGDPPNIIIGTSLGYGFMDFIANTGLVAVIILVFTLLYFFVFYRKSLQQKPAKEDEVYPAPREAIANAGDFAMSVFVFALAVVLLILHASLGITVAFIGVLIGVLSILASVVMKKTGDLLRGVDYKTLLFFIGLFVMVGGLEGAGVLDYISGFIAEISKGNIYVMIAIVLWVSAVASAFVDNIPFAATMIPVIKTLSVSSGVNLSVLAWTLAIGTDIGGSATPIGASANVVGISVAARNGYMIGWSRFCKQTVPITVLATVIAYAFICVRYL